MKRFALVALLAALFFSFAGAASATELKVRGNIDVYGMWSANLKDHDSDLGDGDNYFTSQRMRTYFTFVANENLKAVLGLEIDNDWGQRDSKGSRATWGSDGTNIEVKHAYMDFNFPDTAINVKAGLLGVALPSVFGNPVFDDDAAAIVVSAPITDMFGVTVGYTRGYDGRTNVQDGIGENYSASDDVDMAFIAAPVTLDGFAVTPYFGYAWIGKNATLLGQGVSSASDLGGDSKLWVLGANAELTMFDPLTFAADLIYGRGKDKDDDYKTSGWYAALAASYKLDFMTATLFGTYATGADSDADKDDYLPTLAEGWGLTPYIGGARAFSTGHDTFAPVSADGTGVWTVGLVLDKVSFVDNLSHKLTVAYAKGTSDRDAATFDKKDSGWEMWLVNKYMIYENLAAINELGYFKANLKDYDGEDSSYFATVGFQYKF